MQHATFQPTDLALWFVFHTTHQQVAVQVQVQLYGTWQTGSIQSNGDGKVTYSVIHGVK